MENLTKRDMMSILYMHYINSDCENMFSFDNGETYSKVKTHYNKLIEYIGEDEVENARKYIIMHNIHGKFSDSKEYSFEGMSDLVLKVICMLKHDGSSTYEGYNGHEEWCDMCVFIDNYNEYEFEELDDWYGYDLDEC